MPDKLLHYKVLERLGEGARSFIYKVQDPNTGQIFALKHVERKDQKDIRFIEQMETEYEVSRRFSHPNLRRSFQLKINKSMLLKVNEAFLFMELFDGMALDVELPETLVEIFDTFIQAAQGLKAMHQMDWAHCDIKPNNILRDHSGRVKVIDFGQSCRIGTIKERIQGTPDYIAPEQVNRKPISVQTDVFNLGATLYWAVTGRHIPTMYTVKKKGGNAILSDDLFKTPQDLNPAVPPVVSNMIMQSIATSQSKRPADMDALIEKLEIGKHLLSRDSGGRVASAG
ncbi:MAG: serine/threonine protein kinase [Phycisphaerae bacterium]